MSDEKEREVRVVSPTGRIAFIKNLYTSGGEKDRFSGALVFNSKQDVSKIKKLMMDAAKKANFTKEDMNKIDKKTKQKVFSWGMKTVDIDDLDFCEEGDLIMNFDRNGSFGAPEVKSSVKGPDDKYEDVQESDIKAGDYCRVLISAFGWEHGKGKKGVKINFDAVQFIKEGEAYYTPPTSDEAWDENEFDVAAEAPTSSDDTFGDDSPEVPAEEGANGEDWDDMGF